MRLVSYIKRSPVGKIFYRFPAIARAYHFALAFLGAMRFGFPSRRIFVIGITGTKGKTTTIEILNAILEGAGNSTAILSSLRRKIGAKKEMNTTGNTMPGRFAIQRFLSDAVFAKCRYALIEVTSQGVVLSRHRFVRFGIGALTNIAPEHIEAHGSFENYRAAKLKFLQYVLAGGGTVFLNGDDKRSEFFRTTLGTWQKKVHVVIADESLIASLARQTSPVMSAEGEASRRFFSSGVNRSNAAIAVGIARQLGIADRDILSALHAFIGVSGRLEYVAMKPFAVVVDYAHTPDSLEAIYRDLRGKTPGKLICVLGSAGGGRDKWKRPEMGNIAAVWCDHIILTNEDPHDEDPARIIEDIAMGISEEKQNAVEKILDRREAIRHAVALAKEGDAVIMTGKGSEAWIHEARGRKIPWDERKVAEEALLAK